MTQTETQPRRRSLLDISDDLLALDSLLDQYLIEHEGDLNGIEGLIEQWLNEIGGDRDAKIDNYCALIREMELRAAARHEEAERLAKRVRADESKARSLKGMLLLFCDLQHITKLQTPRYMVSVQNNGGVQPLNVHPDVIEDPARLPEEYQKHTISPDNEAIRRDLAAGKELPFAELLPRGRSLRIR